MSRNIVRLAVPLVLLGIAGVFFLFREKSKEAAVPRGPVSAAVPSPLPAANVESSTQPKTPTVATVPSKKAEIRERYDDLHTRITNAREKRQAQQSIAAKKTSNLNTPILDSPALDHDYIRAQMKKIVPLFAECYEMELETNPDLAGKIVVEMVLIGDEEEGGLIESSTVIAEESDINTPSFTECMAETAYAIELPAPPSGGKVVIRYPFSFHPGDD